MSEVEIEYIVPQESRQLGDTEKIINAMGAFELEQAVPFERDYSATALETAGESASLKLIRTTREPKYDYELREYAEKMRNGVDKHFPDADRFRLCGHFAGIALRDAMEIE